MEATRAPSQDVNTPYYYWSTIRGPQRVAAREKLKSKNIVRC
jgi:hypothetical protein